MRITDGFSSNGPVKPRRDIDAAQPPAPAERPTSVLSTGASDFKGASEVARLVAAVNAIEEVRTDSVHEALRRLAAGAYATTEAAERTAQAILQAAD